MCHHWQSGQRRLIVFTATAITATIRTTPSTKRPGIHTTDTSEEEVTWTT